MSPEPSTAVPLGAGQELAASGDDSTEDYAFAALGSMARYHWPRMAISNGLRAVAAALPALQPYFLAQFATSTDDPGRAGRYLVLLLAAGLAHWLLWSACDYYVAHRVNRLSYEFKRLAFNAVWGESYQHFVDRPSGKVASYVNDLRNHVFILWDAAHYGFLPVLASIPIWVILMWRTASANALIYGVFLLGAGVALVALAKPLNRRQRTLTDGTSTNSGRVFDSYSNFVNVFSFRTQRRELVRNDEQIDGLIDDDVRFGVSLVSYWAVASLLIRGVLWAAIMSYSWFLFSQGRISFVALVVSVTVLVDFTAQYWNVVHFFGVWVDKSAAYQEAYNYLFPGRNIVDEHYDENYKQGPSNGSSAVKLAAASAAGDNHGRPRMSESLEVSNLCFAYPDDPDRLVLDNVSFSVNKGEKLGVVGRSGEGKSTLIKLLLGFYTPTSGHILIDGKPISSEMLPQLQSYVPQDTSLFQETIEYNIGYAAGSARSFGNGQPNPADIRNAARQANIDDFIDTLPYGYQTLVGERGIKLSLGQRQRIAIARAFLKESDVIVLDEATSSLDSETEARVQESLEALWEDKAAIIIAHRLATLNGVDKIIVVENGRIVEQGTKDELLGDPGLFAQLWGLQQAGVA